MEHNKTLEGGEQNKINTAEHWPTPANGHVSVDERMVRHLAHVVFRQVPEYEPPLEPIPPAELPDVPSSADFPYLPKLEAFQLALDLDWAREHRVEVPEVRIEPADFQVTRWLLNAVVEALDRRRPLVQLRQHLDSRVFAAIETRLTEPPDTRRTLYLRSVHACQPVKGVIEACGVLDHGQAVRAMVARLERRRRGWQCIVLRLV